MNEDAPLSRNGIIDGAANIIQHFRIQFLLELVFYGFKLLGQKFDVMETLGFSGLHGLNLIL